MKKKLTQKRLKELLDYNEITGLFVRKVDRKWNAKAGDILNSTDSNGYIQVWIDGERYRGHRLAWLYVHGYFPEV